MRKKIIFAALIIVIVLVIARSTIAPNKGTSVYSLQGKEYMLLTANSEEEWEKGLMNLRGLDNADGMIFLFPDKQVRSFWNKNTYVDLDVYWLDGDKVVGRSILPSIEKTGEVTVTSPAPANKVIELIRD